MGCAFGVSSPVKVFAETLYVEAQLRAGQRIALPAAEERAVYVAEGALKARQTQIPEHAMAVFSDLPGWCSKRPRMRASRSWAASAWAHDSSTGTSSPAARTVSSRPGRTGRPGVFRKSWVTSDFIPLPE